MGEVRFRILDQSIGLRVRYVLEFLYIIYVLNKVDFLLGGSRELTLEARLPKPPSVFPKAKLVQPLNFATPNTNIMPGLSNQKCRSPKKCTTFEGPGKPQTLNLHEPYKA